MSKTSTMMLTETRASAPPTSTPFLSSEVTDFGGMMVELEAMSLMGMDHTTIASSSTTKQTSAATTTIRRNKKNNSSSSLSSSISSRDKTIRLLHRSSLSMLSTTKTSTTKVKFVGDQDENDCSSGNSNSYPPYVTAVHETYRRQDMSKTDIRDYWYSKSEIKTIVKRNKSLATCLSSSAPRRHSCLATGTTGTQERTKIIGTTSGRGVKSSSGGAKTMLQSSSLHGTLGRRKKVVRPLLPKENDVSNNLKDEPLSSLACLHSANTTTSTTMMDNEDEQMASQLYDDTCRGLEHLINPFQRRLVREQKRDYKNVVLQEQARQYSICEISPRMLAKCAKDASEPAVVRAYIQGQLDAAEIYGTSAATLSMSIASSSSVAKQEPSTLSSSSSRRRSKVA